MPFYRNALRRGVFSLLEVAVLLTVLLIVATIVAPRMSRGATSSPQLPEQVLTGQLRSLRSAIAAYARDHGGRFPDGDAVANQRIEDEMLEVVQRLVAVAGQHHHRHHRLAEALADMGAKLGDLLDELGIELRVGDGCAALRPVHLAVTAVSRRRLVRFLRHSLSSQVPRRAVLSGARCRVNAPAAFTLFARFFSAPVRFSACVPIDALDFS